jgi:MFS family permease
MAPANHSLSQRRQRLRGAAIGGTFGAAFLLANAHTPLGPAAADLFRTFAIVGFVALVIVARRAPRAPRTQSSRDRQVNLFDRRYWVIVAAEAAMLLLGLLVIWLVGAPSQAYLPWTVLVVGAHFVGFRIVGIWGGSLALVAGVLIALGTGGLIMTATPAINWVPFVSGVLSGLTLLGGSLSITARELDWPRNAASV